MELRAFFYSLFRQTFSRYGFAYWCFLLKGLSSRPFMAAEILALAVKGHHFFAITNGLLSLERFKGRLAVLRRDLEHRLQEALQDNPAKLPDLMAYRSRLMKQAWTRCCRINPDLRNTAIKLFEDFRTSTESLLNQACPAARD
jgi:hypothetical protein